MRNEISENFLQLLKEYSGFSAKAQGGLENRLKELEGSLNRLLKEEEENRRQEDVLAARLQELSLCLEELSVIVLMQARLLEELLKGSEDSGNLQEEPDVTKKVQTSDKGYTKDFQSDMLNL